MKKIAFLLSALICAVMLVAPSAASYITMSTSISSNTFTGDSDQISVSVSQMGDEAAYEVEMTPMPSEYFEFEGSMRAKTMQPEEKISGVFNASSKDNMKYGNYPLVMMTIYHDANMYPFSVVSPHTITYVDSRSSDLFGAMKETELSKDGSTDVTFTVRNLGSEARSVKAHLYLPRELGSDSGETVVQLGPKEEKEVKYRVESIGALTGSSYSIIASLEYDSESHHYTSFSSGLVKIVDKKENLNIIWILSGLFVALILLFIYLKWSSKKNKGVEK